jgi:hypothetical protein
MNITTSISTIVFCISFFTACGGSNSAALDGTTGAAGANGSNGSNGSNYTVKSNGTTIGNWLGGNMVSVKPNYFFTLGLSGDGISTTVPVQAQSLFYTTTDCSGTAYVNYDVIAGEVFVAYTAVNTPSLFYVPLTAVALQLPPRSYRQSAVPSTYASISFSATSASGTYSLNFDGSSTAGINWNDTAAQIETKVLAGIPTIVGCSVTVGSGYIYVYYQTLPQNTGLALTVSGNTLRTAGAVAITTSVSMSTAVSQGTCIAPAVGTSGALNSPLTPTVPNNPSVTGLSTMSFQQPITIN